jgi:hypothetical protein
MSARWAEGPWSGVGCLCPNLVCSERFYTQLPARSARLRGLRAAFRRARRRGARGTPLAGPAVLLKLRLGVLELLDRKTLDRLDEGLDRETEELLVALERLTSGNVRGYADRFAAALAADAILREALAFAGERHAGQTRDLDDLPFVTHPVEVACLLHEAGYPDEVVAAGVLHDVLEKTDAEQGELERRFGLRVAELVAAVSDDPSIEAGPARKAALRKQVAEAGEHAAVVFAADKVSKARELRVRVSRGAFESADRAKIEHYEASLEMLSALIPGHELVTQLERELEALQALPAGGV